jgi:hypothetical protein
MIKLIHLFSVIALVSLLQACGGGGGGGSMPDTRTPGKVGGVAHDAPLINAPIKVYAWDSGSRGELLGSGTTGPDGDYEISITSPSRPVIVVAGNGGSYVEEASGVSVSLVEGQTMSAITYYESGKPITVQVTPLTHMAACYSEHLLNQGERPADAITVSNSMVSSLFGVEIIRTKPFDVTNPSSANYELTPSHKYGFVTAGISEAMAYISEQNGIPTHSQRHVTSIHWANVACNDIRADGLLDGSGYYDSQSSGVSDLAFGTYDIEPDTYRTLVSQKMLAFTRNTRNATTLEVSDVLTFANALSTSTDPVWNGEPGSPVDDEGPSIAASLAVDSYISGTEDLSFTIDDPVGVAEIRFYVDNAFVDNGDISDPVLSLNTTAYTDGEHIVAVEADDQIGNTSRVEYTYKVDNSGPSVVLNSSTLVGSTTYTATGTWDSPGASITSITVNGVVADVVNSGTWSADISLSSGSNLVTVVSVDTIGNSSSQEFTVLVDLVKPVITNHENTVRFTTYEGQYNLCDIGRIDNPLVPNPVCVRTDRVSLNGLSINGNLSNLEYVLFSVRVEDPSGAGVYTDFNDLFVQYQYLVNGTVVKDWSPLETGIRAPQPNTNYGSFYLPMVTEFLGDSWYQTSITDIHEVTIEVSDTVGNKNTITYQISFDVLVPPEMITVTNESTAETMLAKNFSQRFSVDGQTVYQTTTVENASVTPIYISVSSTADHSASHKYESATRYNRARMITNEEWRIDPYGDVGFLNVSYLTDRSGTKLNPKINQIGDYQDISSDTLSMPADTSWTAMIGYSCDRPSKWAGIYSNYYAPGHSGDYQYAACFASSNGTTTQFIWQSRYIYSQENATGYPLNDVASTTVSYSVTDNGIDVWNITNNSAATMVSGWYEVPANSNVEIRRSFTLPSIYHYTDNEVADLNTFKSYTTKYLDLETSWTIDGRIDVEVTGTIGASYRSVDTGTSIDTYTISRS